MVLQILSYVFMENKFSAAELSNLKSKGKICKYHIAKIMHGKFGNECSMSIVKSWLLILNWSLILSKGFSEAE